MKNAKKFLCLTLTLLMVLSSVGVFASFSDVPENASYVQAVSSLNQLGIITGYEDGTFKPDNDVTRAEFCAMLMRTMGYGNIGSASSAELPFSDVSDSNSDISWAIKNISTAYKMGIVNGYEDGTFKPSNNVAYEEAVKMVVCALGYGASVSVDATPWYANYMSQATTIGLLKNAQNLGVAEKPASRACIAQMLYDALEIPLVENGVLTTKTLLSDYLGYIKGTGYISANSITSLEDPDVNLRANQIQIRAKEPNSSVYEVHTYQTDKANELMDKLGYQIDFYYPKANSNDDVRSLFSYDVKANTTLELDSNMIERDEATSSSIKYYPSDTSSLTNASLAADNIVIYNGKLYGPNASSSKFTTDMLPTVGTVTLLDSDKDGRYDLITIWDYEVYYVTSKSASEYLIVDNTTRNSEKITLDADKDMNLEIVDKSGKAVTYSSIALGNVICYAVSNYEYNGGLEYKRAVVVTDKVTGTVSTVISGDEMEVGGNKYAFSDAAPWMENGNNNTTLEMPKTGDNGTYSLDILGNVFAYNKNVTTANTNYGYLIAYNTGGSSFASINDCQLRILTQSGSKTDFYLHKGTTINGETVSSVDELIDILRDTATTQKTGSGNQAIQQVIKYTTSNVNGRNRIDTICTVTNDTVVDKGQRDIVSDKLYNDSRLGFGETPLKYASSKLTVEGTSTQINTSSAYIFNVPSNDDERSDSDNFTKKTSSFSTSKTYYAEAFDLSTGNTPKVIVIYGDTSATKVDENSPIYVIGAQPSQSRNETTGDTMWQLTSNKEKNEMNYRVKRSGKYTEIDNEWISRSSNSVMRSAAVGDIYRAGVDSDGFTSFESKDILYNDSMKGNTYFESSIRNWNDADYCVIYGSVYSASSEEGVVVIPEYLEEGDEPVLGNEKTFTTSNFSNYSLVLTYDYSGSTTRITEASDEGSRAAVLDSLNSCVNGVNPSKVVIYMANGNIKLMAVVE